VLILQGLPHSCRPASARFIRCASVLIYRQAEHDQVVRNLLTKQGPSHSSHQFHSRPFLCCIVCEIPTHLPIHSYISGLVSDSYPSVVASVNFPRSYHLCLSYFFGVISPHYHKSFTCLFPRSLVLSLTTILLSSIFCSIICKISGIVLLHCGGGVQ